MSLMEPTGDPPQFHQSQLHSRAYSLSRRRRLTPFLSPPLLIVVFSVVVLVFSFVLVPSFLSFTSQIVIRTNSVKKGWDSVNVCLVLLAVLCGVLARKNDDVPSSQDDRAPVSYDLLSRSDASKTTMGKVSEQWLSGQYSDDKLKIYETVNGDAVRLPVSGSGGSRGSSASCADLRQGPFSDNLNDRVPSLDDFEVQNHRSSAPNTSCNFAHFQSRSITKIEEPEAKVVSVDTFEIRAPPSSQRSAAPSPPPPLPALASVNPKPTRTFQSARSEDEVDNKRHLADVKSVGSKSSQPTPPPPSFPVATTACDFAHYRSKLITKIEECRAEVIPVDTIEIPQPSLRLAAPSSPHKVNQKAKRTYQSVEFEEKTEGVVHEADAESVGALSSPPPPSSPPMLMVNRKPKWRQYPIRSEEVESKKHVADVESDGTTISPSTSPPPTLQPRETVNLKSERAYHSVIPNGMIGNTRCMEDDELLGNESLPPTPHPLPSPPEGMNPDLGSGHARVNHRKSNTTEEIKSVLASLYSQKKRERKQKAKIDRNSGTNDNYQSVDPPAGEHKSQPNSPLTPPPPSPSQQQQSLFDGFFRRGSKGQSKKVHSVSVPTQPPPPPPQVSGIPIQFSKRMDQYQEPLPTLPPLDHLTPSRRRSGRPPVPVSGDQSPLISMPPPPPPPFKMPEMKFVVHGDFAKIQSEQSSRCGSPERDEVDIASEIGESEKLTKSEIEDIGGSGREGGGVFCPSPDVNAKADSFIARLRGEWRLEKMNSMKEKRNLDRAAGPV